MFVLSNIEGQQDKSYISKEKNTGLRLKGKLKAQKMYLDKKILYWCTIPIVVLVFCGVVLRTIIQTPSQGKKKKRLPLKDEQNLNDCLMSTQRVSLRNQEFQNHLNRSALIRSRRFLIPEDSFLKRKMFYCEPEKGYFQNSPESPSPLAALSNPGMPIN